jgi:GTP-binding protein HflX
MPQPRLRRESLAVARARAVLVGVVFGKPPGDEPPLAELSRLVETAGGEEVARLTQALKRPDAGTFIGRGKAREVAELVKKERADVVIFDHDLSPAQARNLERLFGCGVIERSELILGIFARRARTRSAKLQVELARLEYTLPRLRRMWTHLERQTGGIGLRAGAGERQIETDRRKIRRRIGELTEEIARIESRRRRMVRSRSEHFTVSLVGYTNAGKSTLMCALTGRPVFVEDKLFATLDTRTGALVPDRAGGIEPPTGMKILVSDTVGFIRDLPHDLVASFHATLEEARSADLLLHVVDASHPSREEEIEVVEEVLEEIGAGGVPSLTVLNKIDLVEAREVLGLLAERHAPAVSVSALGGEGLGELRERIVGLAASGASPVRLRLRANDSETMSYLFRHGFNLERRYLEDGAVEVWVRLRPEDYARLSADGRAVEVLEGPVETS